jgi:hypothetical protein
VEGSRACRSRAHVVRVVVVNPARIRNGEGHAGAGTADRRASVQPPAPRAARRGGSVEDDRPRRRRPGARVLHVRRQSPAGARTRDSRLHRQPAAVRALPRGRVPRLAGVASEQALDDVVTSSIGMRWAVAGPFRTSTWAEGRVAWPTSSPSRPGVGGALAAARRSVARSANPRPPDETGRRLRRHGCELAEQRDDAEIRLMRALDEIPLPQ